MSFLNLRRKKKETAVAPVERTSPAATGKRESGQKGLRGPDVLVRPRISEKATALSGAGAYVFEVTPHATKRDVRAAIEALYRVRPSRISMVRIPRKRIMVKGKPGVRPGGKKAYVYLKPGQKIENL